MLHNFPYFFATENSELGSTGLIKHSVDTQGKGPIRLRPYRTGRKQKEELERQIKERWLQMLFNIPLLRGQRLLY